MIRKLTNACIGVALVLAATGSVSYAQTYVGNSQGQNGNNQGQNCNQQGNFTGNNQGCSPNPAATPELDPAVLYGLGLVGLAGAGLVIRRRNGRKSAKLDVDS